MLQINDQRGMAASYRLQGAGCKAETKDGSGKMGEGSKNGCKLQAVEAVNRKSEMVKATRNAERKTSCRS
jgi:hypothetical protein